MEKYSFFNSTNGDRKYNAKSLTEFFIPFFTNGIFNNGLKVIQSSGMKIKISAGKAFINGHIYENTDDLEKTISISDGEQSRIDNVVIRLDELNRTMQCEIVEGDYATNPVAPVLTRNTNVYDIRIAKINVSAGVAEITTSMIEDCRFNSIDCGNVVGAVQQIDTTDVFNQYKAMFNNWFGELQAELDDNVAANLENQIIELENKTDQTNDAVSELSEKFSPVILYEGEESTSLTLLKSVSLFKRIKVCVHSSDDHYSTVEIVKEKSKTQIYTSILLGSVSGTTYYGKNARIFIDGTNLSIDRNSEIAIKNNNTSVVSTSDNAIKVYKVIGYYE